MNKELDARAKAWQEANFYDPFDPRSPIPSPQIRLLLNMLHQSNREKAKALADIRTSENVMASAKNQLASAEEQIAAILDLAGAPLAQPR